MKKSLIISMLLIAGLIVSNCGHKNPKTMSDTGSNVKTTPNTGNLSNAVTTGLENGTYSASGTISFSAGGVNYSCSISKVMTASSSLTIQTSTTEVKTNGSMTITCYTATTAITTGTYTSSSAETISTVSFIDKTVTPYTATAMTAGSSCEVTITALSPTTVKGTFTATLLKPIGKESLTITDGVIDCTILSK
jgi:hypothetical protein